MTLIFYNICQKACKIGKCFSIGHSARREDSVKRKLENGKPLCIPFSNSFIITSSPDAIHSVLSARSYISTYSTSPP